MRPFQLAALALPIAVANALNIVNPNENAYWVQNTTNTITWQFSQGDPSSFNIYLVNGNNQTLNGPFAIASVVNASDQIFTVNTSVTLREGDNYQVQFVNTSNITQVFATSHNFTVKPPGTAPAPTSSASSSSSAASGTATSPSSSSGTASATGGANHNGAMSLSTSQGVFGVIAACGVASLSALLL
ncbi:Ser-Thr-rich glycosyl-phosphatidyl-inositol-anchored membrane family-domain-containing protein [Cerioporus squamosus]|nr:Ser-Thr-rich glycosyl-phosphatidyl-inositol-anchored membrane family-domain-containing protein [Cerioporus squamosus]